MLQQDRNQGREFSVVLAAVGGVGIGHRAGSEQERKEEVDLFEKMLYNFTEMTEII